MYLSAILITLILFTNIRAESSEEQSTKGPNDLSEETSGTVEANDDEVNNQAQGDEVEMMTSIITKRPVKIYSYDQIKQIQKQQEIIQSAYMKKLLGNKNMSLPNHRNETVHQNNRHSQAILSETDNMTSTNYSTIWLSSTTITTAPVHVIPLKKESKSFQRGVLDLLLPPQRVKIFKDVFDGFKKFLSHTFKRR